jgi:TPR repeat protein
MARKHSANRRRKSNADPADGEAAYAAPDHAVPAVPTEAHTAPAEAIVSEAGAAEIITAEVDPAEVTEAEISPAEVKTKGPAKPRAGRKQKPATAAPTAPPPDRFETVVAAAALIERSLALEDATREQAAAVVPDPAPEPAWPAPSQSDPPWVAAWVRGVNAETSFGQGDTQDAAVAAPVTVAQLGVPSLADAPDDEPPFDAPSIDELCGAGDVETAQKTIDICDAPIEQVAPQTHSYHEPAPVVHDPARLEYLRRAREAAQAHSLTQSAERRVPQISPWTIAAGMAAPLLAIGAWTVLHAIGGDRETAVSGSTASAQPTDARDPLLDYQRGLQLLGTSRARDGLALLQSAAQAGLAPAQYRLAKIYEHGEGAPRDLNAAREWTERAARGGNCRAMHDLGVYYAQGDAVQRNEALAFSWFQQAAELGVVDSQYNLGLLYQYGRGVQASADHALYWFLVAARQHDLNAVDRAVTLASQMAPEQVERAQALARRFEARSADPIANGATSNTTGASCAAHLERPQNR